MPHPQPEQLFARAASAVDEALFLLARPADDALDRANQALADALACLGSLPENASACQPAARATAGLELARLSRSLARAQRLLDHGAGFWDGWTRLRNTLTGGYTAGGGAPEPEAGSRLTVEA